MARELLSSRCMKKAMLLMLLIGCGGEEPTWIESAHTSYQYDIESYSLRGTNVETVTVESGVVTSEEGGFTIAELMTSVEEKSWEDCDIIVEYDEVHGFPTSVKIDCGEGGEGFSITNFREG
jgi:hypothetical protein